MKTLYDKIWESHIVHEEADKPSLLYIDLHLIHEVTSPQAFEGLKIAGRKVRAPEKTLAVVDHNVPTSDRRNGIADEEARGAGTAVLERARKLFVLSARYEYQFWDSAWREERWLP